MPRQPSKIPPEIARFRKPGMQIKCIRGKYYLQHVTSRWDKAARKVIEALGLTPPASLPGARPMA